jgi:hypothetical protein
VKPKSRRTKRVADGGDSAAFSGFFYTQAESCSRSFIHARPTAANAHRWAGGEHSIWSASVGEVVSTLTIEFDWAWQAGAK